MFIARSLPSTWSRRSGKKVCLAFVLPLSIWSWSSPNSLNKATVVSPPVLGRCAHANLSPITMSLPPVLRDHYLKNAPKTPVRAPWRARARASGVRAGELAEQLREGRDLALVERGEHLARGGDRDLTRPLERPPALRREVNRALAPVSGVGPP